MEQWQTDLKGALKSTQDLSHFFKKDFPETPYPILLPLHIAQKIKDKGLSSALAKQFLPQDEETNDEGLIDPISDIKHQTTNQIIHRYKSRVLFMPSARCPIICRYCFRKNELYAPNDIFTADFDKSINYLKDHPEIEEVIFSGGDPLILSNNIFSGYLCEFSKIPHIKYIRIHTRFPIIIPNRVNEELVLILKKFSRLFQRINIVMHVNHPDEFSTDFFDKCKTLSSIDKIDLLSQSVFLKDVNDNTEVLKKLFTELSNHNIKPYYIHHPDKAKGTNHFNVKIDDAKRIYSSLRDELPGWQIPHYMIETPNGQGKTWAMSL